MFFSLHATKLPLIYIYSSLYAILCFKYFYLDFMLKFRWKFSCSNRCVEYEFLLIRVNKSERSGVIVRAIYQYLHSKPISRNHHRPFESYGDSQNLARATIVAPRRRLSRARSPAKYATLL